MYICVYTYTRICIMHTICTKMPHVLNHTYVCIYMCVCVCVYLYICDVKMHICPFPFTVACMSQHVNINQRSPKLPSFSNLLLVKKKEKILCNL